MFGMLLAGSRFSYAAGASGTVTVPSGAVVVAIQALVAAGDPVGSFTIDPGGANQVAAATAGSAIPLSPGVPWSHSWAPGMAPLGGGTVIVFTGTVSYYVEYATNVTGA